MPRFEAKRELLSLGTLGTRLSMSALSRAGVTDLTTSSCLNVLKSVTQLENSGRSLAIDKKHLAFSAQSAEVRLVSRRLLSGGASLSGSPKDRRAPSALSRAPRHLRAMPRGGANGLVSKLPSCPLGYTLFPRQLIACGVFAPVLGWSSIQAVFRRVPEEFLKGCGAVGESAFFSFWGKRPPKPTKGGCPVVVEIGPEVWPGRYGGGGEAVQAKRKCVCPPTCLEGMLPKHRCVDLKLK